MREVQETHFCVVQFTLSKRDHRAHAIRVVIIRDQFTWRLIGIGIHGSNKTRLRSVHPFMFCSQNRSSPSSMTHVLVSMELKD